MKISRTPSPAPAASPIAAAAPSKERAPERRADALSLSDAAAPPDGAAEAALGEAEKLADQGLSVAAMAQYKKAFEAAKSVDTLVKIRASLEKRQLDEESIGEGADIGQKLYWKANNLAAKHPVTEEKGDDAAQALARQAAGLYLQGFDEAADAINAKAVGAAQTMDGLMGVEKTRLEAKKQYEANLGSSTPSWIDATEKEDHRSGDLAKTVPGYDEKGDAAAAALLAQGRKLQKLGLTRGAEKVLSAAIDAAETKEALYPVQQAVQPYNGRHRSGFAPDLADKALEKVKKLEGGGFSLFKPSTWF